MNEPRITKRGLLDYVKCYASNETRCPVTEVVHIDRMPYTLKHSCPQTGISILPQRIAQVNIGCTILEIPYFMCGICGKLYVCLDNV